MAERFEDISNKDMETVQISLPGTLAATATNYDVFFIAQRVYDIVEVSIVHGTAGTGGAATLNIERLSGTEALDAGDSVLITAYDLEGAINTVVTKKNVDLQNQRLLVGDRLALEDSGTLTSVAGLQVSVLLKPFGKGDYR
jgi:hypothetical protein